MKLIPLSEARERPGWLVSTESRLEFAVAITVFSGLLMLLGPWSFHALTNITGYDVLILGAVGALAACVLGLLVLSCLIDFANTFHPDGWTLKVGNGAVLFKVPGTPASHAHPVETSALELDLSDLTQVRKVKVTTRRTRATPLASGTVTSSFLELGLAGTDFSQVTSALFSPGTIRLPWVDSSIMDTLRSKGVQIAEETEETVELDLEPIREELMELVRTCRGKELHRYTSSVPELRMLTTQELRDLVESLDFEAQAA